MPRPRRSYSPEYRVEAAHRVIDSGRPVRDIARELDVHENLLHKWVREERRRMSAAGQSPARGPDSAVGQELSSDEIAGTYDKLATAYRGVFTLALIVEWLKSLGDTTQATGARTRGCTEDSQRGAVLQGSIPHTLRAVVCNVATKSVAL
ncbi:transposase [Nocardia salmonicida]|uniref:transposase n=1 Tax=Nocardia salmonicida TaxID=53431 RepID=UPI000AA3FCDB